MIQLEEIDGTSGACPALSRPDLVEAGDCVERACWVEPDSCFEHRRGVVPAPLPPGAERESMESSQERPVIDVAARQDTVEAGGERRFGDRYPNLIQLVSGTRATGLERDEPEVCPGVDTAPVDGEQIVEDAHGIAVQAGAVEFDRFDDGVAVPVVLVLELRAVVDLARRVMRDNAARLWLRSPNPDLGYEKPLDLIAQGRYRRVIDLLLAVGEGVTG